MSVCITIVSNQLESVASKLDNNKFKYKFLYDSDDKYKTIEEYKLQLLPDVLLFSGASSYIRSNRMKTSNQEAKRHWEDMVDVIFEEERQVAVVNDYYDNPYMVLVMPLTFIDSTQRSGVNSITLNETQLNYIMMRLIENFKFKEGMNVVTWNDYNKDTFKDSDPNNETFNMIQRRIKDDAKLEYKNKLYDTFMSAYKFRMITYYTKLREYGLEDIMRKLDELGYLDERFNNELYLYEEEARRLLAKRLCAISYKDDIKLLIDEGVIKAENISYNLDV